MDADLNRNATIDSGLATLATLRGRQSAFHATIIGVLRNPAQTITPITRRDILDHLVAERVNWAGRLEEVPFLARIWPDLSSMPSTDNRFPDAAGDIIQHRVSNYDWDDDWVFDDPRFNVRGGTDELFVEFLSQMLHPLVRPEAEDVHRLLAFFNECLERDDWELIEVSQISGKPVFEGRRREAVKSPTQALELERYERLGDPQVLRQHLRRIDRDLKNDPAGAIGSSKELVESVCKTILDDYRCTYRSGDDTMALYKKVQAELGLSTDAVKHSKKGSEASVKAVRALVTTMQALAELRNAIGSGHGRPDRSPALTRHARLAFNSAVAVTEFLLDTWHVRRREENQGPRPGT